MYKKFFLLLLLVIAVLSFSSCFDKGPESEGEGESTPVNTTNGTFEATPAPTSSSGEEVLGDVEWPKEMLPNDFPNLGRVSSVYDFRILGNSINVNWNTISEEEISNIIDKLNVYLDVDYVEQGGFYGDGIKYEEGTDNEFLRVVIRTKKSEPAFSLEIWGPGLVKD